MKKINYVVIIGTIVLIMGFISGCKKAESFCRGCDVIQEAPPSTGGGSSSSTPVLTPTFTGGGQCPYSSIPNEQGLYGPATWNGFYNVNRFSGTRNYTISWVKEPNKNINITLTPEFLNPMPNLVTTILSKHAFMLGTDKIKVEIDYQDKTIIGYNNGTPIYGLIENHTISDILDMCGSNAILGN